MTRLRNLGPRQFEWSPGRSRLVRGERFNLEVERHARVRDADAGKHDGLLRRVGVGAQPA